jgi:hypothetical protein
MNKSESIKQLAAALNKAQSEMSGAKKSSKNPFFKSKYADLKEVIECVKAPFANNGLSFSQFPISSDGFAGVETILMHESGEYISNEFTLKCARNDPQGMGSAITYARRYSLQSVAGVPAEDDDGEGAMKRPKAPAVKPMTKAKAIDSLAEAIDSLAAAKNSEELDCAWKKVAVELKTDKEVIGVGKARRAEFKLIK